MAKVSLQDGGLVLGTRGTTVSMSYAFTGDYQIITYWKNGARYEDATHKTEVSGDAPGFFGSESLWGFVDTRYLTPDRKEESVELPGGILKITASANDILWGTISLNVPADVPKGTQIYIPYWETAGDYWAGKTKVVIVSVAPTFIPWQEPEVPGSAYMNGSVTKLAEYQDKSWQFVEGEWQWCDLPDTRGGGRYRNSLIVISFDENGLGNILYS